MLVRPFAFAPAHHEAGAEMSVRECLVRGFAGGLAGVVSWAVVYPVDIVKSHLQTQNLAGPSPAIGPGGLIACGRALVRQHGWRFLLRGLDATLLRAFPLNAVTFLGYEWALRKIHQYGLFRD